jgi:hypothetical protein
MSGNANALIVVSINTFIIIPSLISILFTSCWPGFWTCKSLKVSIAEDAKCLRGQRGAWPVVEAAHAKADKLKTETLKVKAE